LTLHFDILETLQPYWWAYFGNVSSILIVRAKLKQIKTMTIDKIRHYLGNYLFQFWNEVAMRNDAIERITNAKKLLESENRTDIKSIAELNLLNFLLTK